MPTVKLIVEYDGSRYAGWQRQPDQPTIQEAIETAIYQLTQHKVSLTAAGRTDAGVHALAQVANNQQAEPFENFTHHTPSPCELCSSSLRISEGCLHCRTCRGLFYCGAATYCNRPHTPPRGRHGCRATDQK